VFLDRKTDIQEYAIQKEEHLSRDLISHGLLLSLTFVAILYQWFQIKIHLIVRLNYNVLDIDVTVEFPNPLLDAPKACPTNSERNDR